MSASGGKNFDLARNLKEIIDNVEEVKSKIINLESYDLPLYKPDLENKNDVAQKLLRPFKWGEQFLSLNAEPLEAYANAKSSEELIELQFEFFDRPEKQ